MILRGKGALSKRKQAPSDPPGLILRLLSAAGARVEHDNGDKAQVCCPLHGDRTPSAVVFVATNWFYCSSCGASLGLRALARRLDVEVGTLCAEDLAGTGARLRASPIARAYLSAYRVGWNWDACRLIDGELPENAQRFLLTKLFCPGIEPRLVDAVRVVPLEEPIIRFCELAPFARGRHLLAVLVRSLEDGLPSSIQARSVVPGTQPKVLSLPGGRLAGAGFMNAEMLKIVLAHASSRQPGAAAPGPCVLIVEGLTDFIATTMHGPSGIPVLGLPGASTARSLAGPWLARHPVALLFDRDHAGRGGARAAAAAVRRAGGEVRSFGWPGGAKDLCDLLQEIKVPGLCALLESVVAEMKDCTALKTCSAQEVARG